MPIELKILVAVLCALVAAFMVAVIIAATAEEMPKEKNKKHPLAGCVTFRDLLEVEHLEAIMDDKIACPFLWGYDDEANGLCNGRYISPETIDSVCRECWNRPVPKETLERLMEGKE